MTTELPMLMEGSRPREQALGMETFTTLVRAHQGMVFGIACQQLVLALQISSRELNYAFQKLQPELEPEVTP